MMEWVDVAFRWAIIAALTLWIRRVVRRIQRHYGWVWLTDDSTPPIPKSDPGSQGYKDQSAKCIYDVSTTLSQAYVILTRLEPILEALEAILPQVRDELRNAQNRPGKPFTVKRSMGED